MLRILGSARAEQKWNTLLAYFLNPSQPHGFGADLLKAFLDKAGQVTAEEIDYYHRDIKEVTINTEITSAQNNRLDILIRVPGEWFVCIESKVDASEGTRQTQRYLEDTYIGNENKDDYPEDGRYYLFLSKEFTSDSFADEFEDIYWRDVVETFQAELNLSHGQYPERSVSQLNDFLSTIITVTNMEKNDFEHIQKEKVQLLSAYRGDIDDLLDAAESLRQRAIEDWPERFRSQVDNEIWTDEWRIMDGKKKWGTITKSGWYLDDESLEATSETEERYGDKGFRLFFNHLIRRKDSFARGELTYRLRSSTSGPLRDEFHRVYNSKRWQKELESLFEEREITNKGNKKDYFIKTYDVDQSRLLESYFETLAVAFEEHIPVTEVIDEILEEAVLNVKDN
jgi:hypothetical protein